MKQNKETLKKHFETGDKPTQQQYSDLIDSYIDAKQPIGVPNRRFVIGQGGEVTVDSEQKIPVYTLSDIVSNKLSLLKDGVKVKELDLTSYMDDTNLARLISGTVDVNGMAIFTRDDNSIFTVDLSNLKGSVPEYQAGINIAIDNANPLFPIINSTSGSTDISGLVPYTGATANVDLGEHSINLGEDVINAEKNIKSVLLSYDNVALVSVIESYWNGSAYTTPFTPSLAIGEQTLHDSIGQRNSAFGSYAGSQLEGSYNSLFGENTGRLVKGSYNSLFGQLSGSDLIGSYNSVFGRYLARFSSGNSNLVAGASSTGFINSGSDNVFLGSGVARFNQGNNNVNIGHSDNSSGEEAIILNNLLPTNEHTVHNSNITDFLVITIASHGYTIGTRLNFNMKPSTIDVPTTTLNTNINSSSFFSMLVVDANTLKGESITYIKPAVGEITGSYILTKLTEINNTVAIGHKSYASKSNQVVLGGTDTEETYTERDYKSGTAGKGLILKTPDGTQDYRISIDNSGNIVTTQVV